MDRHLTPAEARVLGCLIEKQATTPEYYPLTLNALTNACNQKSNRDPVCAYDEKDVVRALDGLREAKLAWLVSAAGSRVPKYEHRMPEAFQLPPEQLAVLCELLLRQGQTAGQLRTHAARLHPLPHPNDVDAALAGLMSHTKGPLIVKLPLQPGQKEARFMHLLAGEPEPAAVVASAPAEPARLAVAAEDERLAALEAAVAELRQQHAELQAQFDTFRSQFT